MSDNEEESKVIKRNNFFKERANKSLKYFALRYHNTRFAQNVDNLQRFKNIYYKLMEN